MIIIVNERVWCRRVVEQIIMASYTLVRLFHNIYKGNYSSLAS